MVHEVGGGINFHSIHISVAEKTIILEYHSYLTTTMASVPDSTQNVIVFEREKCERIGFHLEENLTFECVPAARLRQLMFVSWQLHL